MRYIKLTMQYLGRRFFYILQYSILPALILAFLVEPASVYNLLIDFSSSAEKSFLKMWLSATDISWKGFAFLLVGGLMLIVFVSAMCGLFERDMRLGDLCNKHFFARVNNNFLILLRVFIVMIIILECYGFICSSLIYLWVNVFKAKAVQLTLSIISVAVMTLLAAVVVSYGILWCPTMVFTGLNGRKAVIAELRLTRGNFWRIFLAVVLPVIPVFALIYTANYFDIKALCFIVNLFAYLFFIGYYTVLMFVAYCDISGTDREDLKKKKIWEVNV